MQNSALAGKSALVIGGTNGIGRGMAEWLAQQGASVTVAGPTSAGSSAPTYAFSPINAQSVADVGKFCAEYLRTHDRLDYLVVTAGIATMQGRTETDEGIDQKLAIHYYGRVAAIQGLLPLLESTAKLPNADVRVLSVLSAGVHSAYANYRTDPEVRTYSLQRAANAAGFYNDLALDALSREHPTVTFAHAAPGLVSTSLGAELNPFLRGVVRAMQLFAKSPERCARLIGAALIAPEFKGGFHLVNPNGKPAKRTPQHDEARDFVWQNTKEVLARASATGAAANAAKGKE
ncbi:hypothetical protein CAOG_03952 [Capsaspora owczarzaki ATCC 30864]|uniref:Oxidoreductase n=1 Tax=Capsaspora owczarzaki (strain ATCC 30864) TaxID=595528 RepID=A0A0D2WP98_CAPO3|nr:hypothetical protein CAOG_03952 [Capsaspora owczarzaki ATCC 30864]KJE93115.1 hypothetical protein CAOG_003952 [Capsaspora owczarzaki ATCC 30864]|eukprot:XP_004363680.1 hypothetical protein CAOG_03952 [Capsaspora owczarzaki ATCC 30864]